MRVVSSGGKSPALFRSRLFKPPIAVRVNPNTPRGWRGRLPRMSFGRNGVSLWGGGTWGTTLPPRGIIVRGTESGFRVVRVVAGEQGRE